MDTHIQFSNINFTTPTYSVEAKLLIIQKPLLLSSSIHNFLYLFIKPALKQCSEAIYNFVTTRGLCQAAAP